MHPQKQLILLLFLSSLCLSQIINISGKVTDTSGAAIAGAAVLLEQGGLSDSTGSDGTFVLGGVDITDKSTPMLSHKLSVSIHYGRLIINAAEKSAVKITVFTLQGRAVFEIKETMNAGTHSLALPRFGAGMYLYRIQSSHSEFLFKSPSIGGVSKEPSGPVQGFSSVVFAKREIIDDIIKVSKAGYLNSRIPVANSDTSGIVVALILQDAGTVTDGNGNVYRAVRIGNQVWTVENLRTAKLNEGTPIPLVVDNTTWETLTSPAYCYYNNTTNADSITKFGALYNWHAVSTGKLAPTGWHVPDSSDWNELSNYLIANGYNWDETISGNKIGKSMAAKTDWLSAGEQGDVGNDLSSNNSSGFSALPGGYRTDQGSSTYIGYYGYWWSTTKIDTSFIYGFHLYFDYYSLVRSTYDKESGFSVRLVRD